MIIIFSSSILSLFFFFFNDTATTEIYTLSLHDALPISPSGRPSFFDAAGEAAGIVVSTVTVRMSGTILGSVDRKSTRLNSSHGYISYAVFCLKKKKNTENP